METTQVEKAKDTLRESGYYVDNLWHIKDVLDEVMKNVVKILYFFGVAIALIYIATLMIGGIYLLIEK